MPKMCEGCEAKLASFGTPTERVKRWCAACAKAHGAVGLSKAKMCEGCEAKRASFGTPTERVTRYVSAHGH